jgi:hypothetical protein
VSRQPQRLRGDAENSKSEAPNPKQIRKPKHETRRAGHPPFRISCFVLVSDFDIRYSNFAIPKALTLSDAAVQ